MRGMEGGGLRDEVIGGTSGNFWGGTLGRMEHLGLDLWIFRGETPRRVEI